MLIDMNRIKTLKTESSVRLENAGGDWSGEFRDGKFFYTLKRSYQTAYGLGEKFDCVNQKGKLVRAAVIEKCFYQGEFTYLSMPFFLSREGFGIYVDTYLEVDFDFTVDNQITISFEEASGGGIADIYFFEGGLKSIIKQFKDITAPTKVFPKWVLGAWMSSNRWRYQSEVEEQLELTEKYGFPHNVLVIEPWSDLTTHYLWGGSKCPPKAGDEWSKYDELDFSASKYWQNPKAMVRKLHDKHIKTLLWVVPVYAQGVTIETQDNLSQRLSDNQFVIKNSECVLNADGTPYEIPHTWCVGSMLPDFTNTQCREHWFNHFNHLLEIGIDGFKTDGGEFVHVSDVRFSDGTTGREGRNAYCEQYIAAFSQYIGDERALFSRAGGQFVAAHSLTWAGDQESTWSEFRSVIKAGLSAGLSGISNWGFDIAGFSGYLPSKALYARAVQTAAFVPLMQWHSDPVANNRCDFTGAWKINDRSPWNIAQFHKDVDFLDMLKKHFDLHYNLIPYQYNLMLEAHETGVPAMRHLALEFPTDANVLDIEDEFMLGEALLVAPVFEDYIDTRQVYLPEGDWFDLYSGKRMKGGKRYTVQLSDDRIPVFFRDNRCVSLNLCGGKLSSSVGNDLAKYNELTFLVAGIGRYDFRDDLGNDISIAWTEKQLKIVRNVSNAECRVLRVGKDLIF